MHHGNNHRERDTPNENTEKANAVLYEIFRPEKGEFVVPLTCDVCSIMSHYGPNTEMLGGTKIQCGISNALIIHILINCYIELLGYFLQS